MAGLTVDNPVTLTEVIKSQRVIPGDTIILLPGIYEPVGGKYISMLNGTEALPITIKPQQQGTVRINGGVEIITGKSNYIKLLDLEIAPTPTNRSFADYASVDYPDTLYITGKGCTVAGCYLHDGMQNLSLYGAGTAKITENLFANCGFMNPDGGHGTNIYTHNHNGGSIEIYNNLFNAPFGDHSVNHWSASINGVRDYYTHHNALAGKIAFFGSETGIVDDNKFYYNHIYNGQIRLGRPSELNAVTDVQHNRVYCGAYPFLFYWQRQANVTNNYLYSGSEYVAVIAESEYSQSNVFNENTIHLSKSPAKYYRLSVDSLSLEEWQALGYDLNSTYIQGLPTTNEIFVYPYSESERWVGMIVIWNWELLESVSVDLSTICESGSSYKLRQMQDYDDTADFYYTGAAVSISMLNHTVKKPTAWEEELNPTTFPTFGCFVVEKA
jgi:hypothetical protein